MRAGYPAPKSQVSCPICGFTCDPQNSHTRQVRKHTPPPATKAVAS